ncbi:MAG: hypothetical protein R3D30_10030 [Hyphomicrobiales bacterium]
MIALIAASAVPCANAEDAASSKTPNVIIPIHYLTKQYDEPVPSLVDPILTDNGVQGARLGVEDTIRVATSSTKPTSWSRTCPRSMRM